jgi:hypothetical protein
MAFDAGSDVGRSRVGFPTSGWTTDDLDGLRLLLRDPRDGATIRMTIALSAQTGRLTTESGTLEDGTSSTSEVPREDLDDTLVQHILRYMKIGYEPLSMTRIAPAALAMGSFGRPARAS